MADNDKLEINFRDLARSASQYVFSSTFPSLERMLKVVQTTSEENKAQVENLNTTVESINVKLNDVNVGLRKLNDAMAKSLGILGKILKTQESSDSGSGNAGPVPNTGINNIKNTAGAVLGAGAMMSVIENQYSAPGPETPAQSSEGGQGAQPSTPVAGGSAPASAPTPNASKAATPSGAGPSTPALQPEKKDASAAGGGKTLLIKASTITFDAGQIIFTSGGGSGASSGGGGGGASSGGGSQSGSAAPQGGSQQSSAGGAGGGAGFNPAESAGGENGRLNTSQLTRIPGGMLQAAAAQPYMSMVKAASEENISWGISDSYRDYPTQVRLAREKGLYSQGGLAATPGRSNHGWGTALDLNFKQNPKANVWLQQNAGRFGFKTIPREPWHWEYKGGDDSGGGTMVAQGDKTKISGEGAAGGGGPQTSASTASEGPKTGPSAPLGASPAMPTAPKPEEKKTASSAAPVASAPTKGAELNKESTTSEVASVTPPARASMNNIMGGGGGQQKESDVPKNPKITDANKAGNVEPEDAAQRYESLFGMKPRVPTGSTSKVA